MANILVFTEQRGGAFKKETLSAVTFARELAKHTGGGFSIAVLGKDVGGVANAVQGFGAEKVLVVDSPAVEHPLPSVYAHVVAELAKREGATYVVGTATTTAKDFLPRVAVRLQAGMVSEAVAILGATRFRRMMWAGNVVAEVEVASPKVVVSVRGTEFAAAAPTGGSSPIEKVDVPVVEKRNRFVKFAPTVSARPQLTEAAWIVAGGRGLKAAENFEKVLGPLADTMNAAIGATRAVVDAGFVSNDLQVGQTGKIVAPDVYVAVGLSGAIQHLAGMKKSKVIVAINKDEEAPIFSVADYGLVDDLFKAVPALTEAIRKHRAG